MARNYMTWITTRRAKTLAAAQAITKAGTLDTALKFLGYLAVAVGFVAGIMAIVPIVIYVASSMLAYRITEYRFDNYD